MMKMKNLTKLAYLGAIALVGIGFTACSSDDDAVENNPSFDGKAVKTQFAINIPRAATPSSRMSAENTQNNNSNFLGMEKIHLLSFAEQPGANTSYSSDIKLADINNGITTTTSSKIYSDVNVPVGTSHFLFYAVAPQGENVNDKFSKGVLDATIGASTDAINFKLQQIATSIENEEKTQLLSVLNAVAAVSNWSSQSSDTGLGKLYASFKNLKAGSANSIKAALENLYNAVAIWADATNESTEKTIATAIRTAITSNHFTASETSQGSGVYTLTTSLTYPRNLNLPDGAVQLTFQNNSFSYDNNSGLTSIPTLNPTTLTYPASLYYFISTDIRTSTSTYDTWPANVADWVSGGNSNFWNSFNSDNAKVTATTRAIALKNNIQYGVANLKLSAYCTVQKLSDATTGSEGSTAKTVNVPADGFKITGVIIGGQPTQVGYNFLPADAQSLTRHIYDKDVTTGMCANYSASTPTDATVNYTMVLPNQLGSNEQTVSFAIEFQNNSSVEFQGVDGVVPVNGKFYLVGKLDPNAQSGITNPGGITNPAVFMPDYQTTVTAKISTLKKAYNTIPDLRATNMQLGLSVDLTWTPGLTFDIDLGGDTN